MASRGTAGIFAVAAIAALLLFAPGASALSTVTVKGADLGDGVYKGSAKCDVGERVISGGFATNLQAYAVVNRAKGGREWTAKALDAEQLTVFAYCSSRLHAKTASDTSVVPTGRDGTSARARCKEGRQAVAGGWQLSPSTVLEGNNSPIYTSRRAGERKWVVKAFADNDEDETDRLTAYAYCLKDGVAVKLRSDRGDSIPEGGNEFTVVECKPGEELLGGGFTTSPKSDFQNTVGPDLFYFGSQKVDARGWLAEAHNYGQPGRITAQATCRQ